MARTIAQNKTSVSQLRGSELLSELSHRGFPLIQNRQEFSLQSIIKKVLKAGEPRLTDLLPFLLLQGSSVHQSADFVDLHIFELKDLNKIKAVWDALGLKPAILGQVSRALQNTAPLKLSKPSLAEYQKLHWLYRQNQEASVNQHLETKQSLATQNALSFLFAKKQKLIVLKKLNGLTLTKSEREYFSRVIKKKLCAIADSGVVKISRLLSI